MKKIYSLLLLCLFLMACQNNKKEELNVSQNDSVKKESKFEMYQMTELAMLMEQMYSYNLQLRSRILDHENLGEYPERFDKIHTAIMTDPTDNDAFFQQQATLFIEAQQAIYVDPDNAKDKFNQMVQSCLDCHSKKCGGPIPRIKKLFIK